MCIQLFRTNKSIFSLANEPPHYPSDSDDMGLESISEPDIDMPDDDDVAALARSETAFIERMLALDTKNYHVWSYRQYLVRKLGSALWPSSSSSSSISSSSECICSFSESTRL